MATNEKPQPQKAQDTPKTPPSQTPVDPTPPTKLRGKAVSESPNSSFSGAGDGSTGYDSPPITSSQLSNPEAEGSEHDNPIYPPGGAPDKSLKRKMSESDEEGSEGGE